MSRTSISSVQLKNFRGFRDHTVSLDVASVLVGQNNAGKSTFIEALRLLAIAARRVSTAPYQAVPAWLDNHAKGVGFVSSFETMDFDFRNITTNLSTDEPARLQLVYANRARLTLWLAPKGGDNFAQLSTPTQGTLRTRAEAAKVPICPVIVMPPLGPLNSREMIIAKSRIHEYMFGRLSSWHFRNQLYEMTPQYRVWKDLLEETWPGVQVKSFNANEGESGKEFNLILREGPFASEAAWVGSGLQAWMQILWFVCRADKNALVVLDEPDVFLHADMQRKIAKLVLGGGFRQAAIATHSSEIISDVEPSCITVIRKRERSSWKPGKKAELQKVIDSLGSRHNIQLGKLAAARKVTLYEGEDQKFLLEAALKVSSDSYHQLSNIPWFDINGVDNWQQAIGAARTLYVSSDGHIPVILVIDRDYRSDDEVAEITKECRDNHLILHCWSMKEIENFLICPEAILRIVKKKAPAATVDQVNQVVAEAAESLKEYTIGAIADRWHQTNKRYAVSDAMREATAIFTKMCETRPLVEVISGKRLISEISRRCREKWSTSLAPMTLCREMKSDEFPKEFSDMLNQLLT